MFRRTQRTIWLAGIMLALGLSLAQGAWAATAPTFRVTEYYLTTTEDFTGLTYDLTLDQDLADDYFIMVRGSRVGTGGSNPDNDYVRVYEVPGGRGELAASGATDVIALSRFVGDLEWEGVVTVVECLGDTGASGFKLLDIVQTAITGTATSGTDTSGTAWSDIDQVLLFGGYHGGGAEFEAAATNTQDGDVVYTTLYPSSTSTLNWTRVDNGNAALVDMTMTTFVIEWGSEWTVQRVAESGTNAGDGADATGEYTSTATSISSVVRDNTWVWGTGTSAGDGIGECSEGTLITLGDGVTQNTNETQVAMGAEWSFQRDFDVYVMTHSDLAVDYRFKVDGDSAVTDLAVTVDSATDGYRFGLVYNGCAGSGSAHPRDRFWARYTADTTITVSRGYQDQPFPAWVQGIDFSGITYTYTPAVPTTLYVDYPSAQSGTANPTSFAYTTPFFSAVNNHGVPITTVDIELTLSSDTTYSSPIWDSGDITVASTGGGYRIPDVFYGTGTAPSGILESGQNYIWRIRTKSGTYSDWSGNGTIGMTSGSLTARFYSGPGDGGCKLFENGNTWDTEHDDTAKTASDAGTDVEVCSQWHSSANTRFIGRGFLSFNTADLPDAADITAGSVNLYVGTLADQEDDGNDYINIVHGNQANDTTLVDADYNDCGDAVDNPTQLATAIDLGDMTASQYSTWTLNTTGLGQVSKTGYSKFGVREGHDIEDDPLDGIALNRIRFGTSELTGIDQDPYLEVTWGVAPTTLYVDYPSAQSSSSNPTDFSYATPFFSAVNNHGLAVTTVEIELTLSSDTSYSSPIWDSGDITVTSTNDGSRIPDVFYGTGTAPSGILESGQNYIWRIRTKSGAVYSDWSSNGTIAMASGSLTARFYAGSGDGCVGEWASGVNDWDTVHDDPDQPADHTDVIAHTYAQYHTTGPRFAILRGFVPIDTSGLPDVADVTGATLNLYATTIADGDDDGQDYIAVVGSTTQASTASLTDTDYNECGTVDNPTKWSNNLDLTGLSTGQYHGFTFNATGLSKISKTGFTMMGVREGHDIEDAPIDNLGGTKNNYLRWSTSEETGIGQDPYLEVTWTATPFYYSVGTDTSALYTGNASATDGVLTLTGGSADPKIGVGDEVREGSNRYYITGRNSPTEFTIQDSGANSGTPGDTNITFSETSITIYRAFNTLSDAETYSTDSDHMAATNLVTSNYQLNWPCYNDGAMNDAVTIDGYTTGADNYIRVYTPTSTSEVGTSQRHSGIAGSGFRLRPVTSSPGEGYAIINIYDDHVRIEGIELDGSGISSGENVRGIDTGWAYVSNTDSDLRIDSNIVHDITNTTIDDNDDSIVHGIKITCGSSKISNNIVYTITNNSGAPNCDAWGIVTGQNGDGTSHYVYNNTVFDIDHTNASGDDAIGIRDSNAAETITVQSNNYVGNLTSAGSDIAAFSGTSSVDTSSTNNVSSDGTADDGNLQNGQTGKTSYSDYFVSSTGSIDLHLKDDSNILWTSYGADLDQDSALPMTDDIDGDTRHTTSPDIGADEYTIAFYYSVGTDTSVLYTGNASATDGVLTLTGGSADPKIGVGDEIRHVDRRYYITGRNSSTEFTIQDSGADTGTPGDTDIDFTETSITIYRAYNTLNTAESGCFDSSHMDATDLVANNYQLNWPCYNDAPMTDATEVNINSYTTGPNNYIRVYTPTASSEVGTSQRHNGTAGTGFRLVPDTAAPDPYYRILNIVEEYVRVEGIEIDESNVTNAEHITGLRIHNTISLVSEIHIEKCIVHDVSTAANSVASYADGITMTGGGNVKIANNIVYNIENKSTEGGSWCRGIVFSEQNATVYCYNNTVYNVINTGNTNFARGISRNTGPMAITLTNNYVGKTTCSGGTQLDFHNVNTVTATYNVSSDLTADDNGGAGNQTGKNSYSSYFQSIASGNENLHLKADSNTLWTTYGTDLDSDDNFPITDDIEAQSRDSSQPDIGADEYVATAWYDSDWSYRKRLTFDNSSQTENLLNFPLLVKLTSNNFDFSKAKTNGEDIRFMDSDNATVLPYEIEDWDSTNKEACIWVRVPQIDGSSSTDSIFMYYGNTNASDDQDATAVWVNGYVGVWHLDEDSTHEVGGIQYGYKSGNLVFTINQWGGGSNGGEIDISGDTLTDFDGSSLTITPLNNGVAMNDADSTTVGYIMYSAESVHTRFSANAPHADNADHFIGVKYQNNTWSYDNNSGFVAFTPVSTDILVAEAKWGITWKKNLSSGRAKDSTVNANHGTPDGPNHTSSGKVNGADDFDGTDDYVNCGDPANGSLDMATSDFSISAWVKPDALAGVIVNKRYYTQAGYSIWIENDKIRALMSDGTDGGSIYSNNVLNANDWYYVVMVADKSSNLTLYMDTVLQTQSADITAVDSLDNTRNFDIGYRSDAGSAFLNGQIDELRISKTTRSADWIAAQYLSMGGVFITYGPEIISPGEQDTSTTATTITVQKGSGSETTDFKLVFKETDAGASEGYLGTGAAWSSNYLAGTELLTELDQDSEVQVDKTSTLKLLETTPSRTLLTNEFVLGNEAAVFENWTVYTTGRVYKDTEYRKDAAGTEARRVDDSATDFVATGMTDYYGSTPSTTRAVDTYNDYQLMDIVGTTTAEITDYKNPDTLDFTISGNISGDGEWTEDGDGFNEREGCYTVNCGGAYSTGTPQVGFELDGSANQRYNPVFKFRHYTSFTEPTYYIEEVEKTNSTDYNADLIPFTDAYLMNDSSGVPVLKQIAAGGASPAADGQIWAEAEDGVINGYTIVSDASVSGGRYIHVPNGTGDNTETCDITVYVPTAGTYKMWTRAYAADTASDSFFIKVDSGTEYYYGFTASSAWVWSSYTNFTSISLTAGYHTINIRDREDGARLDKILLLDTSKWSYTPTGLGGREPEEDLALTLTGSNITLTLDEAASSPNDATPDGDAIYFGSHQKFFGINIDLDTNGAGGNGEWQYWDGDSWEDISVSETATNAKKLYADGAIYWDDNDVSGWQKTAAPAGDETGCVGYWDFNEASSGSADGEVLYDKSGNSNNGLGVDGTNDAGLTWTTGRSSNGIDFDGTDDYVGVSNKLITASLSAYTISLWAKSDGAALTFNMLASRNTAVCHYWYLDHKQSSDKWHYSWIDSTSTQRSIYSDDVVTEGEWYHIAAVNDGTDQYLYINGVQQSTVTNYSGFNDPDLDIMIGGYTDKTQYWFDGEVDEARVFDYARTADEIAAEYERGRSQYYVRFVTTTAYTTNPVENQIKTDLLVLQDLTNTFDTATSDTISINCIAEEEKAIFFGTNF